ncbi:MAG: hypothetical protein WCB12_22605 [Bryobacteraceae bacterium]
MATNELYAPTDLGLAWLEASRKSEQHLYDCIVLRGQVSRLERRLALARNSAVYAWMIALASTVATVILIAVIVFGR